MLAKIGWFFSFFSLLMSIVLGLLIAGGGVALMIYAQTIIDFLGTISWAEEKMGGTRKFYIILGLGIVVIGFLFVFGVFDSKSPGQAMDAGFGRVGSGVLKTTN